ncbi:MAG TPA: phosphotransferase family protein [Candidatus Dormibacteraeota bacterium]|nr:phosphotransferase family protein [Candidatus Dormibacteraeota bacterium]
MNDFRDKPSSIRPSEELDLAKLEPFLRSHFPSEAGTFCVTQFPSGHSNLTYCVQIGDRQMVLRRPPFGSKVKSAHDMGREFHVLSKLRDAYPPAPKVLLYCDDSSVLGAPFFLMEPISGVILRRDPPPGLLFASETARGLSECFADNLARLHSIDYIAIGLADLGKPQGYVGRQVHRWIERYHDSKTHDLPEVERISSWMQQNLPPSGYATLIHNDYKFDNVILDPDDLTKIIGILDWEMCTLGDPLSDLGTTLAYWVEVNDSDDLQKLRWGPTNYPGSMTRDELVQRYAQTGGRDVSNMVFYLVFARFKVAVIVQQIYYRYHTGLTKDSRFAVMPEVVRTLMRASWQGAQSSKI